MVRQCRKGRPMEERAKSDGTIGKALVVLDQVAAFGRPVRFAELQPASAYPKATLYRFLQILTNQGLLAHRAPPYRGTVERNGRDGAPGAA